MNEILWDRPHYFRQIIAIFCYPKIEKLIWDNLYAVLRMNIASGIRDVLYNQPRGRWLMKDLFVNRLCLRSATSLVQVAGIHRNIYDMWNRLSIFICDAARSIKENLWKDYQYAYAACMVANCLMVSGMPMIMFSRDFMLSLGNWRRIYATVYKSS